MKNILLVFLCFCLMHCPKGFSNEEPNNGPISLAALEGEPSSIVHGCVSVITGDYVESQTDLIIPGVEPIVIQRSYSSHPLVDRSMGNGWSMNNHGYLNINYVPPTYKHDEPNCIFPYGNTTVEGNYTEGIMTDESGSSMMFSCPSLVSAENTMTVETSALEHGVTNCARGLISGRTNWNNTEIYYKDKHLHAKTGAGTHYIFDRKLKDSAQKDIHRLLSINKANGTQISYEYDKHSLNKILLKNLKGELVSWASIERPKTEKHYELIRITSPSGNKVEYTFHDGKSSRSPHLLVEGTSVPTQKYVYTAEGKKSKIRRKELPDTAFYRSIILQRG